MSFGPLLEASPAIQFHAFAAMAALMLGALQLGDQRARCRIVSSDRFGSCL
jgi:uncharacterized membrane protein